MAVSFNVIDANLGNSYLVLAIAILVIGARQRRRRVCRRPLGRSRFSTDDGYISSSYRDVVVFGVLLLVLIVRPNGLFKSDNVLGRVMFGSVAD